MATRLQNQINRTVNAGTGGANLGARRTSQNVMFDPNTGRRTVNTAGRNNRMVSRNQRYRDIRLAFGLSAG